MDENGLKAAIERVKAGRMSRRSFVNRMIGLGLTVPIATQLLALGGVAYAQPAPRYKPTKAGGGGTLKLLWWQGPTLLNPHFATGTKDQDGSRLFYEPLAGWDANGELQPTLAAELPSTANGGLSPDGKWVIWKLKQNVKWHDGKPFTADDVVFNWAYSKDPATATVTTGSYNSITVEKIDDHTVKITSETPMGFWADAFVGAYGQIIPKHLFEAFTGSKSRDAPTNLSPVGTGPYLFKEFRPGDLVSGTINPNYHQPNRPYFDAVEMKGGGDATSAARAVLQTGEYDLSWNLQVEDEVLARLEQSGKGKVRVTLGGNLEMIQLNNTDPNVEVDGERSSLKTKHPTLTDPAVREALSLLIDRESVHKYIYGRGGNADLERRLQPRPVQLAQHAQVRVQRRQGERASWRRPAGKCLVPTASAPRTASSSNIFTRPPPTAPARRPSRSSSSPFKQGRHRGRTEVGDRLGVLLLGRGEPRHLPAFLRGPADVHDRPAPCPTQRCGCSCSWAAKPHRNRTSGRAATSRGGKIRSSTRRMARRWRRSTR